MLKNGKSDAAVPSMKPDPTSRFIYYLNKSFPYNMYNLKICVWNLIYDVSFVNETSYFLFALCFVCFIF